MYKLGAKLGAKLGSKPVATPDAKPGAKPSAKPSANYATISWVGAILGVCCILFLNLAQIAV